ncbi:MAG TPA: hypothetical protein VIG08_09980 [Gemmatimonadales bacterium]
MSRALLAVFLIIGTASPAHAQGSRPIFKYGKFLLAAGSIGMNYLAAKTHDKADDNFHALERRCLNDPRQCDLDASGRYVDGISEMFYQESLRYDRRARRWLFGGEAALLGSAVIFVWELTRHTSKPDNIPFEPELRTLRQATGIGLRVEF